MMKRFLMNVPKVFTPDSMKNNLPKGAFNNYRDKKRGEGKSTGVICQRVGCKMLIFVHSKSGRHQNWIEFGPRSC